MKILVTGSSGTIGTRLCERLLKLGNEVTGIDRRPNAWNPDVNAITVQGDLLRDSGWDQAPARTEVIVHLAANARVYDLVKDPGRALENILSTFTMLEWARRHPGVKVIFASSRECYGNVEAEAYTEDIVRIENCESPYTASKLAGEALVESYRRCYGIPSVIVRFSNVYGRYDDSDRVVPLFIRRARRNEPLTVFGEGKCLDFTYIDDTVNGIMLMIDNMDKINGEAINIASGAGTTLMYCAERIKDLTGSSSEITVGPPRVGEVTMYTADLRKAKKLLGYVPSYSFEEGLGKAVEWYLTHTRA